MQKPNLGAAQLLLPTLFSAQTLFLWFVVVSSPSPHAVPVNKGAQAGRPAAGFSFAWERHLLFFSKGVIRAGWAHPLITRLGRNAC